MPIPIKGYLEDPGDMPELLPPYDDRIFKLLLIHEDSEPVLKSIVAAILGRKVKKVLVRNNEIPVDDITEKQVRLDVNCITEDGEQIDIEMQASRIAETGDGRHENLMHKSLFYLCELHSSQSLKGKSYADMARTWQVTFCAYTIFSKDDRYLHVARMRDEDGNVFTDDITMVFVELPKAVSLIGKPLDKFLPMEVWTVFFGCANRPEHRKFMEEMFKRNREVGMAGKLLKSISKDERERAIFRSRRMFQTDLESNLITAEQRGEKRGVAIGRKRGIEIGEKRGVAIGEKRGVAIGEKRGVAIGEKQAKVEVAKALKADGVPVELIAKVTKLTPGEIRKLIGRK